MVYIVFKYNIHRRRRHAKSIQDWIGEVSVDYDRTDEDGQAMLLLLQQQHPHGPQSVPIGATRSPFLKGPTAPHSPRLASNNYPLERLRQYSKGTNNGCTPVEKFQLISRMNNSNNNLVDHFLVRDPGSTQQQPLPNIPSFNSLTGSTANKYEEPNIFLNGIPSSTTTNNNSSHPKLLPPVPNAHSTNTSVTTATITTTSGESENNESEPDYAEPMMIPDSTRPPPLPVPPPLPDTSPKYSSGSNSDGSFDINAICGKHEKFLKLTDSICKFGQYSMMSNLGVGVYLTPQILSSSYLDTNDIYFRYGIDTSVRQSGYCSLSPVVTVSMSKPVGDLNRPIVLCFRHCISFPRHSGENFDKQGLNLVVLWQGFETKSASGSDRWIEVVRYGEENLNTPCHLQYDTHYAYLTTKFFGKYMLCLKNAPEMKSRKSNEDLCKMVNFSITTEQFSSTENLIKVFVYDNLPSSTLNLRNDLPSSSSMETIKLQIGKWSQSSTSTLRLTPRAGSLCFELQCPTDPNLCVKGTQRVEIPLSHLWNSGPNSLLHCSFIVSNCFASRVRKESSPSDDSDDVINEFDFEQTYENEPPLVDYSKYEVKIWQKSSNEQLKRNNMVVLSNGNTRRLKNIPGNTSQYYCERSVRLFEEQEIALRSDLIEQLDQPRGDLLDWREFAIVCNCYHYLPYFASQSSPTTQIMDLWEAKVFCEFLRDSSTNGDLINSRTELKEMFYSKLVHILQTAKRSDLIDVVLSHQC